VKARLKKVEAMTETLQDYDYSFPPELVAQSPLAERDASRMLLVPRSGSRLEHSRFCALPDHLKEGDLLVVNDTSVRACRLYAQKPTGGKVEVFLLRPVESLCWEVFLSPARGLKEGMSLEVFSRAEGRATGIYLEVRSLVPEKFQVRFSSLAEQARVLASYGEMPLPPYIERSAPLKADRARYQTVFASQEGAVAAPTAGLHFSPEVLKRLRDKGVGLASLTLHVGAGTFLPVKTERIEDHVMHEEWYRIPEATLQSLQECRARGSRIVAVGTTSLRALEAWAEGQRATGWTRLFIRPGFPFRVVDALLTNFHQPKSTLLMLVSAFAGRERIAEAYREAIQHQYRLFSYGDCMLIA